MLRKTLCLSSDERQEERKRGTQYERKSLKSRKEERIGTEKSDEWKSGTKEERKSEEMHLYYVIGRARGRTSAGRRRL